MSEAIADMDADVTEVREDEGALKPSRRWRILLFLLAFSPLLALGIAIANTAVDIPMWDDWERGEMWERHYQGKLDFEYLYSPHIEHRSLFPRLISQAFGTWFGGDMRSEIWAIYAIVVGTTLLAFQLLRHTLGRNAPALWPATFLVNTLLSCPVQYPDFLWAGMLAFMLPFLCLMVVLSTGVSRLPVWAKFVVMVIACEIGTHSFSEGLVIWPVAVCLPLFSPVGFGISMRSRVIFAAAMAAVFVATLIPYFTWHFETTSHISHTYSTPTGETSSNFRKVSEALENPKAPREYFFKAIGNPVVRIFDEHPARSARDIGRVIFGLFVAAVGFLFWRRRDGETWNRLLPWIAAGSFATSTAILLALGQSSSPHRATMPRYIPMTVFMLVALVAVGAYAVTWWSGRAKDEQAAARRAAWGWGAAVAFAVLQTSQWTYGFFKMGSWRDARYEARAALVYIKLFDPKRVGRIDNTLEFARKQAIIMNDHGLIHPPLVDEWSFGPFERKVETLGDGEAGAMVELRPDGILAQGFAELPDGRVADGVLITLDPSNEGEEPEVLGFVEMRSALAPKNPFLDRHFGDGPDLSDRKTYAAFDGIIEIAPDRQLDPSRIGCWAIDARTLASYRIGASQTTHEINRPLPPRKVPPLRQ